MPNSLVMDGQGVVGVGPGEGRRRHPRFRTPVLPRGDGLPVARYGSPRPRAVSLLRTGAKGRPGPGEPRGRLLPAEVRAGNR
jgi:hypothetical protein